MILPFEFDEAIRTALKAPPRQGAGELEQLYRQSAEPGQQESFRAAIARALSSSDPSPLLNCWGYRLGILSLEKYAQARVPIRSEETRLWGLALSLSVVLGLIWLVFSAGRPPVPSPEVATPLFWLGWAPATALFIMSFVAAESKVHGQRKTMGVAALIIVAAALWAAWSTRESKGAIPLLVSIHLPILTWIVVGAAATRREEDRALQRMSYIFKSAEALMTSAIYFAGAAIFGGLTLGIFSVLGVHFPQAWINRVGAMTLGLLPILAIASTYNPRLSPAGQDFSAGPARLMRLLCRLLFAPALGVLALYVLWFIPRYFRRAFEERSVLIVYNVSLAAVLLLIVLAIPNSREELSAAWQNAWRNGIKAICTLSLILNLYSLAAVGSRTIRMGISPNRHATIGWDAVTFLLLASILVGQWRSDASNWMERFRRSFAGILPLAALWVVWVLLAMPLFR
jgi:hypothetical protein